MNRSRWFFTCITPRHIQKNVAIYWYNKFRRFSIIITWCHKISTNFPTKNVFFRTLRIPSCCNFLVTFYQKTPVEANVYDVAAIFALHFVRNCSLFVILWQLRILDWFVNKQFGTWYKLLLCPFIQARSQAGCGGCDAPPQICQNVHFFVPKWAKNGVLWGG